MKTFLTMFLALCLSVSLFANQNETTNTDGKFGLGIALNNQLELSFKDLNGVFYTGQNLNLSMSAINSNIKTDLDLSVSRFSYSKESKNDLYASYLINLGIFHVNSFYQNLNMYYGIKLGILLVQAGQGSEEASSKDLDVASYTITPALGGEYFFAPYFSVFTEVGLNLTIQDDDSSSVTVYALGTYAGYGIKWYFN